MDKIYATTVLAVIRNGSLVMASDGQVSTGNTILKHTARKVRMVYDNKVALGFAGSVADALTLAERLEKNLEEYKGQLLKSCVELTKSWRTDKYLRNLDASIIASDGTRLLFVDGMGDVIEPDNENILAIGSGYNYARAAAEVLYKHTKLSAETIVKHSMHTAANLCLYTNDNLSIIKINREDTKS